jgi:hypothetical protein
LHATRRSNCCCFIHVSAPLSEMLCEKQGVRWRPLKAAFSQPGPPVTGQRVGNERGIFVAVN